MLHDYSARKWKIDIDGEDISDEYILWEAMNIRSVGPVLYRRPQQRMANWILYARAKTTVRFWWNIWMRAWRAESQIPAAGSQISEVKTCLEKLDASL